MTRGPIFVIALIAAGLAIPAGLAGAQEHPVTLTASVAPRRGKLHPGDTLTVGVLAAIPSGWHLYSITQPPGGPFATTIDVAPRSLVTLNGSIGSPVPISAPDPNFGIQTEWYEDSASFRVPLRLAGAALNGKQSVVVRVGYQTCTARYCLPPREDTLAVAVLVDGPAVSSAEEPATAVAVVPTPTAAPAVIAPRPPSQSLQVGPLSSTSSTGSQSFALFLWLAATMGALSLLTPCVFPMVPITISYFSRGADDSRARVATNAVLYAGGIVAAFTGIGVGLSLLMGVAGLNRFAASPVLNLGIAALFIVFALSLFDVLHLALPSGLLQAMDRASNGTRFGRTVTALLMGVTFALTTFTCTAPFVGTLLVSATRGDWRWPTAGLLAFSSVFALPFLVLALVPHALSRIPQERRVACDDEGRARVHRARGGAQIPVERGSGAGLGRLHAQDGGRSLGCARHHARRLLARRAVTQSRRSAERSKACRARNAGTGRKRLHLERACRTAARRARIVPPPAGGNANGVASHNELSWMLDDLDGGLEQAEKQHKLVLIDFTGYTCTNCRWMEANMFPRPEVARELNAFVRVRLFTDGRGALFQKQQSFEQEKFRTVALPLYAIVDSLGTPRATFLGMTRDTREFVVFLRGGGDEDESHVGGVADRCRHDRRKRANRDCAKHQRQESGRMSVRRE